MSHPSFPAPAKLNLFLHVTGRRADGYHLLQTLFTFLDYGDELELRVRADGKILRVQELTGVPETDDLTLRAARLLQAETGCALGAEIALHKRLPIGGGLGGGSSDAATTLLVLNRLWGTGLTRAQLQELGLRLGADVPVFIFGQSAWAEGVGERLQAYFAPEAWYVVLSPPVSASTKEIFSAPELTRNTPPIKISGFSLQESRNDLEPVACARYPAIREHLAWLRRFGAARMTGSGACVFAPFGTQAQASEVLDQRPRGWAGFVARGLNEHPLRDYC